MRCGGAVEGDVRAQCRDLEAAEINLLLLEVLPLVTGLVARLVVILILQQHEAYP